MLKLILFSFLFSALLALYNVSIIKWGTCAKDRPAQAKLWHLYGWIIRFLPVVFITWSMWGSWTRIIGFTLIYTHLGWTMYDMVINLGRGLSIFYQGSKTSGTGSWIDRTFSPPVIFSIKLILLISTIIYLILIPIF